MTEFFARFLADNTGATAIEYGLIAGGIALAIVTVVSLLGEKVLADFGSAGVAWP